MICQLCGPGAHVAPQCGDQQLPNSPMSAFFTAPSSPFGTDPAWYPDSRATHHLTNDPNTLSFKNDYSGHESVRVGDGTGLKISSTRSSKLYTHSHVFNLHEVLHVPAISKTYCVFINSLLIMMYFLNFTLPFFL